MLAGYVRQVAQYTNEFADSLGDKKAEELLSTAATRARANRVEPMASALRLEEVLKWLHDSEINAGLQTFFADGLRVWIGDPLNGIEASAEVRSDDIAWSTEGSIARWLHEAALSLYPTSDYARRFRC